jgi:hypothetical protein
LVALDCRNCPNNKFDPVSSLRRKWTNRPHAIGGVVGRHTSDVGVAVVMSCATITHARDKGATLVCPLPLGATDHVGGNVRTRFVAFTAGHDSSHALTIGSEGRLTPLAVLNSVRCLARAWRWRPIRGGAAAGAAGIRPHAVAATHHFAGSAWLQFVALATLQS